MAYLTPYYSVNLVNQHITLRCSYAQPKIQLGDSSYQTFVKFHEGTFHMEEENIQSYNRK